MEKYVKLKDINDLLMQMHREPRSQHEGEDYSSGVSQVAGMIVGIETFEFEAPKEGKWIERVEKLTWCEDDVEVYYDCSLCGTHNFAETPYCPNCGAKMIKE